MSQRVHNNWEEELFNRVTVGIIDTGLLREDLSIGFPTPFGVDTKAEKSACLGGQCWGDDITNVEIRDRSDRSPEFEPSFIGETPWHGSQVAQLALGGVGFIRTVSDQSSGLQDIVRIRPYRATEVVNDKAIIRYTALSRLFEAGKDDGVNIFTVSLGTKNKQLTNDLVNWLRNYGSALLAVFASGNHVEDFFRNKDQRLYPAALSTAQRLNGMLAVAAHDGTGNIAPFSARGRESIGIAAPGCDLEWHMTTERRTFCENNRKNCVSPPDDTDKCTRLYDQCVSEDRLYGTSFAAPLVSFAAALLGSLGLKVPNEVQARVIIGATHDSATLGRVVFEGSRLDIMKAITLYSDQIALRGDKNCKWGKECLGKIIFPDENNAKDGSYRGSLCKDVALDRAAHVNIRPVNSSGAIRLHYIKEDGESLSVDDCDPAAGSVHFKKSDGTEISPQWSDVLELTTRKWEPPLSEPTVPPGGQ